MSMSILPLLDGSVFVEAMEPAAEPLRHHAAAIAGWLAVQAGATVWRVVPTEDPLASLRCHGHDPGGLLREILDAGKLRVANLEAVPLDGADAVIHGGSLVLPAGINGVSVASTPDADGVAHSDLTLQALSGLADLFGEPDGPPLPMGGAQAAYAAGLAAFTAAVALARRRRQGLPGAEQAHVDALSVLSWVNWKSGAGAAMGQPVSREGRHAEWVAVPCVDGHFAFIFTERDWPAVIRMVGDERLGEARFASFSGRARHRREYMARIEAWMRPQTLAALSRHCLDAGLPSAPVLTPLSVLSDAQLRERRAFVAGELGIVPVAPYRARVAPGEPRAARPPATASLPLAGMRILDLGIITAGAGTTGLLADLGAQVIKVEATSYPDPFRAWSGSTGDSPLFAFNNRNKRGIALDLKTPQGKAEFLALAGQCDVIVENFRRGVLERLGLDFDTLRAANPGIVLASISGLGHEGPDAAMATFGSTLEALSGQAAVTGQPDGPPLVSGRNLNLPDQLVCLYGAAAIIAAVSYSESHGVAMHLDVAQRDVALLSLLDRVVGAARFGAEAWRRGTDSPDMAFQGVVPCTDGWLAVTVPNQAAENVAHGLGIADAAALERWAAPQALAAARRALRGAGAMAEPVCDGTQMFARMKPGSVFARSPAGRLVKGFPFQFSRTPLQVFCDAPALGEHTEAVRQEFLNAHVDSQPLP